MKEKMNCNHYFLTLIDYNSNPRFRMRRDFVQNVNSDEIRNQGKLFRLKKLISIKSGTNYDLHQFGWLINSKLKYIIL